MHDFFEGIGPFVFKLCARFWCLVKKEYGITAEMLNRRIQNFHYGKYDSKNKPSSKFTDDMLKERGNYSIKQRAGQSWCFLRNFFLIAGDVIPDNDPHRHLFSLLLKIMDIVFAPFLRSNHADDLADLIHEFFDVYRDLFGEVIPINKMHHLVHYPDMIRLYGPPIRYWCMRFEAFHYAVKKRAQQNGNFKNITKSMSGHLQARFCADMLSPDRFHEERVVVFSRLKEIDYQKLIRQYPFLNNEITENGNVFNAKWVTIGGWEYVIGSIVIFKSAKDNPSGLPQFAQIVKIFSYNNIPLAILSLKNTDRFCERFHGYVVENIVVPELTIIDLKKLDRCEPLETLKSCEGNGISYVCPRHVIY